MMRSIIAAVIAVVASASFADRTANQGWVRANFAPSNVVPRVEALEGGSGTNRPFGVDGPARPLPPYLHELRFSDSYPDDAAYYYRVHGGAPVSLCSSVRDGNTYSRNFDFPFDDRAEFVVHMSSGPARFASVGVAQVGTNLTERFVTSGRWSRFYKCLPGATVDGINENGVVVNINVVDGVPSWHTGGDIHPLGAVRWALDNGTSAASVAASLAARIAFPQGWVQNFHYMVADESRTFIVENGTAYEVTGRAVMTNFRLYPSHDSSGAGQERYTLLAGGSNITNAWYTRTYAADTDWVSEFHGDEDLLGIAKERWASGSRESHRGEEYAGYTWWQTLHTSVYDIRSRTLRLTVQESGDWYSFAVDSSSSVPSQAKRWAMFIIPLDNQFYGFELKASTNNFLRSSPENARLVFYSQSELADETIGPNDRMRLYVCSYEYGEDGRSYTRIPNTMEETRKWHELVAIVSVDYLVRTDGSWLRDDNDSLVWCYIRNTEDDHELDRAGHLLWRPCAPARWFSALPEWAR